MQGTLSSDAGCHTLLLSFGAPGLYALLAEAFPATKPIPKALFVLLESEVSLLVVSEGDVFLKAKFG